MYTIVNAVFSGFVSETHDIYNIYFQRYVAKLRSKNTIYKQKRAQLSELRAEKGILTRTVELLRNEESEAKKLLSETESAQGISGYWETQTNLEKVR
ncbi:unnamed protein product [Trichobilharzia regenti]|nr:unnamed protein product [Trichobilharzia regenti]